MKPIKYITIILGVILTKDSFSQTYVPNKTGVKMVSLEGCIKKVGGAPCDSCFMFTDKFGKFGKCMHISEIRAMIDTSYAQDSVIIINNATGTYSLKNEYGTYYEFGYKFTQSGDTLFLTDLDGTKTDTAIITAGGATTNTLNLSGNTLTSTVNAVADTSLVIGTHILSLSGNSMTSNTNGITDTSLVIGTHVLSLSGNTMTTNTNGITDTSLVIGLVNGNLATNTITLNVNGITDTVLVIGRATLNLAGNQITINVNGVTDTTLVIGTVSNTSSTNSLTTTVNGMSGSSVNIINSNTNSLSGNTITGSVNGVSDTVLVIGRNTLNLSGNEITTNVNGVTDTTLVIGVNTIGLSGNTITSSVNGKSDTTLAVGVNSLSYGTGTGILTSSVNGVSDTTTITPVSGQGGIYGGSGVVYNNAMAEIGSASATDNFGLGHFSGFPNYTDNEDYGLLINTASGGASCAIYSGDSATATYSWVLLNFGDAHINTGNNSFTESGSIDIYQGGYLGISKFMNSNLSEQRFYGDSIKVTTPQLNLKINNSYGVNGYVLTSNGTSASWQPQSSSATYTTVGSGSIPDDTYAQVLRNRDFAIGYSNGYTTLNTQKDRVIAWDDNALKIINGDSTTLTDMYTYYNAATINQIVDAVNNNTGVYQDTVTIQLAVQDANNLAVYLFRADSVYIEGKKHRENIDSLFLSIGGYPSSGQFLTGNSNGSAIWQTKQLTGSASLNFASTAAQGSSDLTITVTGASVGDVVSLGVPNGSVMANTCYTAWVSSSNTVNVRFNNYSSSSSDPSSGTFNVIVHK